MDKTAEPAAGPVVPLDALAPKLLVKVGAAQVPVAFDEEKNIDWAKELEDAGCHVIYGMPGMKMKD